MTETRSAAACEKAQWLVAAMDAIGAHLSVYPVPVPGSVNAQSYDGKISILLTTDSLSELAAGLLSWAATLTEVTSKVWRSNDGRAFVSITGKTALGMEVFVYDGTDYGPAAFGDLQPGARRTSSLEELRVWAAVADGGEAA